MTDGRQLLAEYAATGSEMAFRELVGRYVDLVYSSALRLVNGDTHRAEDVTQTVFADLARMARTLSRGVMLGGWLHRHTCFVASKTMRAERRRQARERQAVEMNSMEDHSAVNLASVAPVLDEAINQLGAEDRAAILLRFFEQRDFRGVGEALGNNEEAARKRVDRALGKLELLLKRRGVALSAAALGTALGAQAVSAAPAGLAISISSAVVAGTATGSGTALTLLKIMTMTKLKAGIIGVVVVAAVATPLVIQHQNQTNKLRAENEALRKQQAEEIQQLEAERDRLLKLAGRANPPETKSTNDLAREVLRLRGEVGKLRQENANLAASKTNGPSALSGITSNPEMYKVIRDSQKMGMSMIYKDFTNRVSIAPELNEKFVDLLADDIMENVDHVTAALRDGKSQQEIDQIFSAQEAALREKVQTLLGADAFTQYQDYTKNLASYLTAEQFKAQMTGEKEAKDAKSKQLYQLMQEETQAAITSAGLPADFQTMPILNFRNMASEEVGEQNLKLIDGIFERVGARAGSFLSPEEIQKFNEFRTKAINGNRMALMMNRNMMRPGGSK
jgi:RNA polymerase sigma factor (sigma-70 family)